MNNSRMRTGKIAIELNDCVVREGMRILYDFNSYN